MVEERIEEITKANEAFYAAFESLDIANMDRLWAKGDHVSCIHPGWAMRQGWPAVRDSWVLIFNNTFSMEFTLSEVWVHVAGDLGWVTCVENIESRQDGVSQESHVLATNLYERVDGQWLMIHHHGSPFMG